MRNNSTSDQDFRNKQDPSASFSWQGFSLKIPEVWSPSTLKGSFHEGYVRLSSPQHSAVQIRWSTFKKSCNPEQALENYKTSLERVSARRKEAIEFKLLENQAYEWTAKTNAVGFFHVDRTHSRVFIIELIGEKRSTQKSIMSIMRSSFEIQTSDLLSWQIFGLKTVLPRDFALIKSVLLSGKTTLCFKNGLSTVEASRWAFGSQLLAKHDLARWASEVLGNPVTAVDQQRAASILKRIGKSIHQLAFFDEQQNQIHLLKASLIRAKWSPSWDCLGQ